jgi:glyoxylase I family protein
MTIPIRGIAPLLQVFDMPAALHFYRDIVGFEVAATSSPGDDCDWALLRLDGSELMLNTAYERDERPPAPDPARAAAHGDVCLYFGCPDVDQAHAHLRSRGVELAAPSVTTYGFRAIRLTDPDGYLLCFHWPAGDR